MNYGFGFGSPEREPGRDDQQGHGAARTLREPRGGRVEASRYLNMELLKEHKKLRRSLAA
jgi:hypothetical protein